MFEKSLYDLIRGLRNHKGNEKAYIENSLKECRAEIRGNDMDVKATALLKLIYLEMFGHDMSWASFHVLEVMSSPKYMQKRVGYLGAVQSFRIDTEVLMLATNLLKKDIVSPSLTTMTLPIITLPHVITSSLAMSVLSDLLPRLNHSSPMIRKKTIVTVYRLALVYPETLRPAWPKIKERLMDESEDSSVTAAIVNVVCELGWRRPQDFLPLAPRLFELLVDSGNNWMAIKLIKLFATMTPLEPRLVKKLLPPLTSIIRTTPAMSLLYECINGIIQGGILGGSDEGEDEIATLCVNKLRGMIMVQGDPNLKYVALLAFNHIVVTHPFLVAHQEDVIMDCIDSPDMSIRLRALDLVVGMVSQDNLMSIVGRLMRQLRASTAEVEADNKSPQAASPDGSGDDYGEPERKPKKHSMILPDDYRVDVIRRILKMCSSNNYGNLTDFDWYIDILIQLARSAPAPTTTSQDDTPQTSSGSDIAENIGSELRNLAVKVKAIRPNATRATESIIVDAYRGRSQSAINGRAALRPCSWIVGEYTSFLQNPEDLLDALLHFLKTSTNQPEILTMLLQAIPKVFAHLSGDDMQIWSMERKTMLGLVMARIVDAIEPLGMHPDLEVQERAVEFTELMKLAAEAAAGQEANGDDAPLLITQAIPSLFSGLDLHSIAVDAQRNVPMTTGLDLDQPISSKLNELLRQYETFGEEQNDVDEIELYYHSKPTTANIGLNDPAITRLQDTTGALESYQNSEEQYLDPDIVARRRIERLERNKDDPFYIGGAIGASGSGSSTPFDSIIRNDNGQEFDVDSIPIMKLDLGRISPAVGDLKKISSSPKTRQRIQVEADETLVAASGSGRSTPRNDEGVRSSRARTKVGAPLGLDSSNIAAFSLEDKAEDGDYELEGGIRKVDEEMAKAMKEVEKLRLEMQRASERIHVKEGVKAEGEVVKKKKKNKIVKGSEDSGATVVKKKKKKVQAPADETAGDGVAEGDAGVVKPKKKKGTKKKAEVGEPIAPEDQEGETTVSM